jgi:hypothetical protein
MVRRKNTVNEEHICYDFNLFLSCKDFLVVIKSVEILLQTVVIWRPLISNCNRNGLLFFEITHLFILTRNEEYRP